MKKTLVKKLILMLSIAGLLSSGVFVMLITYNKKVSSAATLDLSTLYISEMMLQVQDHFETVIDIKIKELSHIAEHTSHSNISDIRASLSIGAQSMDFDYLALYDENGNYDTLLGEAVWYRDLNGFIADIQLGKSTTNTGYITSTGGKYLVFGIPAKYDMSSGNKSCVMLVGFSVNKLYNYINLDKLNQLGSNSYVDIIVTNGSYVLKSHDIAETSFYDHIGNLGNFIDMDYEEGVYYIEKAMASGTEFSARVSLDGEIKHIYGAPAYNPNDWYFVISMPQGPSDEILGVQNKSITHAFIFSSAVIIVLIIFVFILYLRMLIQLIEAAEAARQEAETANNAKSAFLSNMSHDIRTPMNAIVGFTEIIEDNINTGKNDVALEYVSKMKRSSDYMRNLISDVLDMSKIESGALVLSPEPILITKTIDTVSTITNSHAETNHQTFNVNIHDIIHDGITCDRTRLKQILINLLSNAMKFTASEGTITLEVWQEVSSKGENYIRNHFIVKDNGIGMSEDFKKNMFESFSREDSKVRKIEGTGLGLTITKRLLDMMEGEISVESKEGQGSTFTIVIDTPKAFDIKQVDDSNIKDISVEGLRILLAEDNDFNYDIAQVLLGSYGFIIERAENGKIAVEKYCSAPNNWDLILMDLRMPELNGYEATTKIREFEGELSDGTHIPIFALSADVFAEDIGHCRDVGMEGHIAKPINIKELMLTLQKHLDSIEKQQ